MKYWIFQNNQVLGPYEPDDMSKIGAFSPESLVCPEGRRGTSMGDWQRAGMVPDLSIALVRATSNQPGRVATLSIAGLPPEPTLKDLAALGSLQEKVAMLEDVVVQLQEGLRAKDAELTAVHQELAGKSKESSEIKAEATDLHRESDALKRQISGLEERLASVRLLSETLDKAVEEERKVEQDVAKQGETLAGLAAEVESLRKTLDEKLTAPPPLPEPPAPAPVALSAVPAADIPEPPASAFPPSDAPSPFAPKGAGADFAPQASPFAAAAPEPNPLPKNSAPLEIEFPTVAPSAEVPPPPAPLPSLDAPAPAADPVPLPSLDAPAAEPVPLPSLSTSDAQALPDAVPFGAPAPIAAGFDPMSFGGPPGGAVAEAAAPEPVVDVGAAAAPAPKSRKAVVLVVLVLLIAAGGAAVLGGFVPGLKKPQAPAAVLEPAPLPPPEPATPPVAAPDSRQVAVDIAKEWNLPGGRTLGGALAELAPPSGNLSPWMAETLNGTRVQVNYFARGAAPGSPTIAYEFEVDTDAKSLVGRNAAAKSVLTGKAATPPTPPKAKPVKVKPKKAAPAPEADLDSMLDGATPPEMKAAKAKPKETVKPRAARETGDALMTGSGQAPAETIPEPAPADDGAEQPKRPSAAKRANKAKGGKASGDKASDAALLDDLLQE